MKKKKILKHFEGESRLVVDDKGKIIKYCTDKATESQGFYAIQRAMNKKRKCNPSASIPIDLKEVPRCTKTPHAP